MITLRVAQVLAYEVNGTAWEAACLRKGKDPLDATADDILGYMPERMERMGGKLMLPFDDERMAPEIEEMEEAPTVFYQDPKAFVAEVTEIAGLTKTEKRVVGAIVDGSPIPDGKDYTGPLSKRLGMSGPLLRKHWSNAKKKLRDNWAAE